MKRPVAAVCSKTCLIQLMIVLALSSALLLREAYAAGPLYVAPSGNDASSCLSAATACKTITGALAKAASGDTIYVQSGTYNNSTTIVIAKNITIIGADATNTIINGNDAQSLAVMRLASPYSAYISNVTIRNGGIGFDNRGNLSLSNSIVSDNGASGFGGGIYTDDGATLALQNVIVRNNRAQGGGGIYKNGAGAMSMTNVTISGNSAVYAGGIYNASDGTTLTNVTISGNQAATSCGGDFCGGGAITSFGSITLTNVTINENSDGLKGGTNFGSFTLNNTILAGSTASTNCATGIRITSGGHNLDSGNSCGLTGPGDLVNTAPLLAALANNGGLTPTHALLEGSSAIDGGDNTTCPTTDQRGMPRPVDGNADQVALCDIGAYEAVPQVRGQNSMFLPLAFRP